MRLIAVDTPVDATELDAALNGDQVLAQYAEGGDDFAGLGTALGLFVSAFAQTEFQAVQFMPAIVLPQIMLSGLFVARDAMAGWLRGVSDALPFTYAYDALARTAPDTLDGRFAADVGVVCGSIVLALALGAATLRRRTP